MPRLRLFILWIVFVCVPLQGCAATAMAFCGPGHAGSAVMADRAAHGARTAHEAHEAPEASEHLHNAHAVHDGIPQATPHAAGDDGASTAADTSHPCGTCAACHAVALTGCLDLAILRGLRSADLAEPALVPATRVPRVLDRPPRA